jgi:hypothetical protein
MDRVFGSDTDLSQRAALSASESFSLLFNAPSGCDSRRPDIRLAPVAPELDEDTTQVSLPERDQAVDALPPDPADLYS